MNKTNMIANIKNYFFCVLLAASSVFLSACAQSGREEAAGQNNSREIDLDAIEYTPNLTLEELQKKIFRTSSKSTEKDGFSIVSYEYLLTEPENTAYSLSENRLEFPAVRTVLNVYVDKNGIVTGHEYEGYLYKHIVAPRHGTVQIKLVRKLNEDEIVKKFPK